MGAQVRVRRRLLIAGAEDITIDHSAAKAYIAAQDRWSVGSGPPQPPGIYVLDLTKDTALPERLPSDLPGDFRSGVRGLSLFIDASGHRRIFTIHDRGHADYAVEILDVEGDRLRYVRTVADAEHLISCNDLVALDGERFYVTNDHGTRQQLAQVLESFAALPWSNVVFYDGSRFHTVAREIEQANGIALDHRRKRLYVASTRMRRIYQYAWDPGHPAAELTDRVSIELDGCPDNLEWNENGAELWVAADPSFLLLAVYASRTPLLRTAPSRVFCLHFDDGAMPRIECVFDDATGQTISAASVAAVHGTGTKRRLLIGAPFDDHFLDCDLTRSEPAMTKPVLKGEILHSSYDGITDDLLTAGLGVTGLAALTVGPAVNTIPRFVNPLRPTVAELRRTAILMAYNGLLDRTLGGGYGWLYGPKVIAGDEYLACLVDPSDPERSVSVLLQVPAAFNPDANGFYWLVAAATSGSRGIYGAVPVVGEWALQHNCAVVYVDKGTGIGVHDIDSNLAFLIDGEVADADALGPAAHFKVSQAERAGLKGRHRLAFKHAHSKKNAEAHWGEDVLGAIDFAFALLGKRYPEMKRQNTKVIGAAISNGGGAVLRAAEQDTSDMIDAVVVSEPAVQPTRDDFKIQYNEMEIDPQSKLPKIATKVFSSHSKSLLEYMSFLNVFQPCLFDKNWCSLVVQKGLLPAGQSEQAAQEAAQEKINGPDWGILAAQNPLQWWNWYVQLPLGVAVTYANAYGGCAANDSICGYGFAATTTAGEPCALPNTADFPGYALLFTTGNGIPPFTLRGFSAAPGTPPPSFEIKIVCNKKGREAAASSDEESFNAALELYGIVTGTSGASLTSAIVTGIGEVRATGNLQAKPAIIVQGRSDAVVAPNHCGRPYFALNQLAEVQKSNLRYYEVTNAHHFDSLNAVPQYDQRYLPLHYYFVKALDLMRDHLSSGQPLPASQVIVTVPRGSDPTDPTKQRAAPLTPLNYKTHLPDIDSAPVSGTTKIEFDAGNRVLTIPVP